MQRVIAAVACCLVVAACSEKVPSLNLSSTSAPTDEVQFDSEPAGAEVKTSSGQTCRTPCELAIQVAPTLSATFVLDGYESQSVSLKPVTAQPFGALRFTPNPVHVELRAAAVAPPTPPKPRPKKRPAVAAQPNAAPVASADPGGPPPAATFVGGNAR